MDYSCRYDGTGYGAYGEGNLCDIIVIGGGITGAAITYEAASRGLSVALFEKGDFSEATSAAASKLIHGGLRYLNNVEFSLVRESLRERRTMANIAPNFVYPFPMLFPHYRSSLKSNKWLTGIGLTLTTATVNTANEKYVQIRPFAPAYPSAVPDVYNTEVMVYRGFWLVNWFKEQFGLREMQMAKKRNTATEALFDELIENIPPGSMGLMLQPYWSPGMNTDADAKGAIIGFGDVHTRGHIYRSILEGLGYALKDGMLALQKKNKVKIKCLRVSGGGSQSNAAMQITADIFNLPAQRPHTYETSALGAAIDAAVGLKLHTDFPSAVREMTRITDVFEPIPGNRDLYRELFERVYLKMYGRLKPIYNEIRDITGYPNL
ncbi:MAG: FAD-dependent oxidoreductase [Deltaproteobacteria bacterium]|nr:FAD-dependent oxidoreductase [Deltaproteobacteria bacterium]